MLILMPFNVGLSVQCSGPTGTDRTPLRPHSAPPLGYDRIGIDAAPAYIPAMK